jgi:hypothetical protein
MTDKENAEVLLRKAVDNPDARFREGQWEAIDAVVNHRRKLMVVQRTGWGKSSVYFISTRILRDRGMGPTVIVSPLLALMRNQIEAARRLGIHAVTVNSTNTDDWPIINARILSDRVDAMLISPERLSNEAFVEEVLQPAHWPQPAVVTDDDISQHTSDTSPDCPLLEAGQHQGQAVDAQGMGPVCRMAEGAIVDPGELVERRAERRTSRLAGQGGFRRAPGSIAESWLGLGIIDGKVAAERALGHHAFRPRVSPAFKAAAAR